MSITRRGFLSYAAAAAAAGSAVLAGQNIPPSGVPLGLNTYCLRALRLRDLDLLDYTASLKLDTVFLQDSLDPDVMQPAHWAKVRAHAAKLALSPLMTGGGAILPKTPEAFESTVKTLEQNIERARGLGSPVVRSVLAGDRASFPPGPVEQHMETVVRVLKRVRSKALDAGLKIVIENHKDLQAWETRTVIETAGKDFVGSYLDTGNGLYVMEHPMTAVEELGPYATCVHFGDSIVYEHPEGIAVQRVPLGEGQIDFRAIVARIKQVCPPATPVYIKPITGRPADVIRYLEPDLWKMYPKARAADLTRFLALARKGKPYERPMVVEDLAGRKLPDAFVPAIQHQQKDHMERSVAYAQKTLGLGIRAQVRS